MKLKQLLLFVLCLGAFACSTESTNTQEEPTNDNTLVKKIVFDAGTADEYPVNYNYDGNKLTSVDYGGGYKNVYTYDANDNLIKDEYFEANELSASIALEYSTDNKINKFTETFLEPSGLNDRQYEYIFNYNNDGTITMEVYVNYNNTSFELDETETITFEGMNLKEISYDDGFTITYAYDDKNNAFKNIHAIEVLNILSENEFGAFIPGTTNNITSYVESGAFAGNENDTYEYTYNDQNYPITGTITFQYGSYSEVSTIDFYYE